MLLDFLVHQWLSCVWLIRFVMTMTAITHQINHHIAFEFITVIKR
ncbi:Uncharacterised protein [Vibrio cholerae]|nr:Uncharacterised protein [Vibrio cholerae]CSC52509.1 Uncharacterised protein [Vibrio cholerae]CSC84327.1 Uncharacterised protein [Vibrio cholerae]CSI33648.1 Uncharacterised protein [Vibrio cholerae]